MLDKIVSKITSDGHIPVTIGIFAVGCVFQWFHHMDASFVAFTSTVLTFLGAHWYIQNKPDGK